MCPAAHVHLVLGAQVVEVAGHVAAATPFGSGPRLGQRKLEPGENRRRFRDVGRALRAVR